jgi:hypothetical protein
MRRVYVLIYLLFLWFGCVHHAYAEKDIYSDDIIEISALDILSDEIILTHEPQKNAFPVRRLTRKIRKVRAKRT